jgi:hypothetical protein
MGRIEDFREDLPLGERVQRDLGVGDLVRFYRKSGGKELDEVTGTVPENYKEKQEGFEMETPTGEKYFIEYGRWLDFVIVQKK